MRVRVSVRAGRPALERGGACVGELVGALRRPGHRLVPLAGHEALLLERAQDAVEVADVHALLADHGREPLEEVVAVPGTLVQQEQDRGDLEALDPTAPASPMPSVSASIHMYETYSR